MSRESIAKRHGCGGTRESFEKERESEQAIESIQVFLTFFPLKNNRGKFLNNMSAAVAAPSAGDGEGHLKSRVGLDLEAQVRPVALETPRRLFL